EKLLDLADEVAGQDDRARVLDVVRDEQVVEPPAGRGVHAEVDLVEHGHRGTGREADDGAESGPLATGELAHFLARVELEGVEQLFGEPLVPGRPGRRDELEG